MNEQYTDFANHTASMEYTPYAVRHLKNFHGPAWLNINAMQMEEHQKTDDIKKFQPATLYNVYLKDELNYGIPMYKCVSVNEMIDIFKIHIQSMGQILNDRIRSKTGKIVDINNKYSIVETGRTAVEYKFNSKTELLSFNRIKDAEKRFGVTGKYINNCVLDNRLCKGYLVTRRYVRLDMDENILEVLG